MSWFPRLRALRLFLSPRSVLVGAPLVSARAIHLLRPSYAAREREERLVRALSHELRTPLAALLGTLELALLRRRTPEQYEDVLRQGVEDAAYLSDLLDEIFTLAQIASGQPTPFAVPLDLRETATEAVADMRPRARGKGQTLVVAVDEPLLVHGNALLLRQVVNALLDNALTYTPRGSTVDLRADRSADMVRLAVRDDGPGIAPEHLPYLFEPFYRVDPSRALVDGERHPGLGLSRATHIARAHQGQLSVESKVAHGSTFTLLLPHAPLA